MRERPFSLGVRPVVSPSAPASFARALARGVAILLLAIIHKVSM